MSNQFDRALAELGAPAPQNRPFRQSVYRQAAYANQKAASKAAKTRSKTEKKTQTRAPKTREKVQTRAPKTREKVQTRAPKTREKVQTRAPKAQNQDSWRSSYQTATAASVAAAQATYNPARVQTRAPLSRQGAATGKRPVAISKVFGQGRVGKTIARRKGQLSKSGQLSAKFFPNLSSMQNFQGMGIETTPEGYSHPQLPQQLEQEVPNYYAASRQARRLPQLPADAGETDHEIAKFLVEKTQSDPDKRQTVEETIYVILSNAAQSAHQAKDTEQARVLMGYANRWAQAIQKAQQTPAPQQSADQNDQGETSGFSLTEWVQDSSNTRWMIAFGLFSLAAGLHFYQKQSARSRVAR
jgi:hypothetical protein